MKENEKRRRKKSNLKINPGKQTHAFSIASFRLELEEEREKNANSGMAKLFALSSMKSNTNSSLTHERHLSRSCTSQRVFRIASAKIYPFDSSQMIKNFTFPPRNTPVSNSDSSYLVFLGHRRLHSTNVISEERLRLRQQSKARSHERAWPRSWSHIAHHP